MNRAVVLRAAAGLVAYLQTERGIPEPMVVVGFDARHNSDVFARDTAAVVVGAGGRASILPRPLPTPVLAFAIRHLGADAGVMVTASHNPPQDNGYKVYLGDGSQIVPPTDAQIASHIAAVAVGARPAARRRRLGEPRRRGPGRLRRPRRRDAAGRGRRPTSASCTPRCTAWATTPCVGCSPRPGSRADDRAEPGRAGPGLPDGELPEPRGGRRHRRRPSRVAREVHPDIVIANDPDADRCAAAVLDRR